MCFATHWLSSEEAFLRERERERKREREREREKEPFLTVEIECVYVRD